uniref:non-specific serine/threonine protein kinase n=1 Tax=Kalanchoe fedtschenkoi TaxID=63787 RepID=A0A7N0V8Q1_KALFE
MSCFPCCMSEATQAKKSLKKSIREFQETKTLASFSAISFKSDASKQRFIQEEISKMGNGSISAQVFKYSELCAITNNFDSAALIGEGGFGKVYKGTFPSTNQVVAVKKLDRKGFQGNREFLCEVLMLSLLHHPDLVTLVGYCAEGDQRILVYEYMANVATTATAISIPPSLNNLQPRSGLKEIVKKSHERNCRYWTQSTSGKRRKIKGIRFGEDMMVDFVERKEKKRCGRCSFTQRR